MTQLSKRRWRRCGVMFVARCKMCTCRVLRAQPREVFSVGEKANPTTVFGVENTGSSIGSSRKLEK